MTINVDILTKKLSEYSLEANNASEAIAKGLFPLGLILLALFFLLELQNWKNLLNRHNKKVSSSLWIEFGVKYIIGLVLILTSGYILDALVEISILITKKVNSIYPPSSYVMNYSEEDYGSWGLNLLLNATGWILEKISKIIIIYILIFLRYVDLYFLKALAPIMIGFYYSDEFRPVVMNFFKTFIAYSLLGLTLLILTIVFGMIINEDLIKGASEDSEFTAFLTIVKGIIYILIITGSVRKIKSLVGVN